jgi:amino acid transporter
MGADGLSSSAYGPEESFKVLLNHLYLVPLVILAVVFTITIISIAYSRVIEHFPHGGGGYVVASHLLGPTAGVVSGSALAVDYVLTITTSVAAGADAFFSFFPPAWSHYKVACETAVMLGLLILNLRGVKESVVAVAPVFLIFVLSHILLIVASISLHWGEVPRVVQSTSSGWSQGLSTVGLFGMLLLFFRAYSMGAGTYTGIEAVSNGLGILREPQVRTGKRTMLYMAVSLALAAGGLFVAYLLVGVMPVEGKTLNSVLAYRVFGEGMFGHGWLSIGLILVTLFSEAGLLVIAAQTGFIDGPRVLANMAVDSWFPKRFASLSERFTMQNGVLLFGLASIAALWYTGGNVDTLVLMYSINVFITFCLTELSMMTFYFKRRKTHPQEFSKIYIHVIGGSLCFFMLNMMVIEKFMAGGWVTMVTTVGLIVVCFLIRAYYQRVKARVRHLDDQLKGLLVGEKPTRDKLTPSKPTAVLLVEDYGSVGVHSLFSIFKIYFPDHFKNVVFVSVGVVNSGNFKGSEAVEELDAKVHHDVAQYADLARRMGIPAGTECALGTEIEETAAKLCLKVARQYPRSVFFGSKLVFQKERWYQRWMHNQTATAIQNRLQWEGLPMTILPVRVFE